MVEVVSFMGRSLREAGSSSFLAASLVAVQFVNAAHPWNPTPEHSFPQETLFSPRGGAGLFLKFSRDSPAGACPLPMLCGKYVAVIGQVKGGLSAPES